MDINVSSTIARRSDLLRRTRAGLLSISAVLWTRSPDAIPSALGINGLKSRRPSPDAYNVTYPNRFEGLLQSQRQVTHGYDSMARLNSVQTKLATENQQNPAWQNVISGVQFNAFGAVTSLNHLGVTESRTYNVLGQMTRMTKGSLIDVEYRFSTTANDGKILSQKNWLSGEDVVYAYDELERLISASTTAGISWGLSWSYDGFGNRLSQTVTQGTGPSSVTLVNGNTNRISSAGYAYDSNGNMTQMPKGSGSMTLDYDLSNRVSGVSHPDGAEQYRYAPDNRRVWRSAGRTACYASRDNTGLGYWSGYGEGATEQVILYSPGGQKMGAYCLSFSANLQYFAVTASEENVYYGGRLVGKRLVSVTNSNNGLVSDFTADRLQSKGNGSNYYPYGESKTSTAGDDREGFATYTRDEKSGLDYADQRWYASGVGRFGTPDPFSASGSPNDPGSLNRYAYVSGDPTNFNDPEGLAKCYVVSATSDHSSEVHCTSQLGTRFERVKLNDFYGNPMSDTDLGKYKRIVEATIGVQLDDDEAQEGKSKINAAVNYAIQLLNANPDCEQLYGRSTRPEMFGQGAVSILQSLRSKDSFHWVEPGRGFDVSARTSVDKNDRFGFVWSWTASIALDVQTHSQQWHNMQELTHTVLHELGHVLAELGFMGGEFSHNDGNLTDPEEIKNQARNNALISERCFRII